MGVSQCYVFLMALLQNEKRLGTSPARMFTLIERFTFQYSVVCKLPGNKLEKIYSGFAQRLYDACEGENLEKNSKRVQALFAELEAALKQEAPSETVFNEGFMKIGYRSSEDSRVLIKYILSHVDGMYRRTDEQLINFATVNIEHLLPQSPHKSWGLTKKDIKPYVNRLGNLTLLSKRINSKVQNLTIADKIDDLDKSELPITKTLVADLRTQGLQWGQDEIEARQRRLAELSFRNIWKL
jgi:hypothetical protein